MSAYLRAVVEAAFAAEAVKVGVTYETLLQKTAPRIGWKVVRARRRALRHVLTETACTGAELAKASGFAISTIRNASRETPALYSKRTAVRLAWAHGAAKADAIMHGRDRRAKADLAAWNRLGAKDGGAV